MCRNSKIEMAMTYDNICKFFSCSLEFQMHALLGFITYFMSLTPYMQQTNTALKQNELSGFVGG